MGIGIAQIFNIVLDRLVLGKRLDWNRSLEIVPVHRLQEPGIIDFHVFTVDARGDLLLVPSYPCPLAESHDKRLKLAWPLLYELAARGNIARRGINPCLYKIRQHGHLLPHEFELEDVID